MIGYIICLMIGGIGGAVVMYSKMLELIEAYEELSNAKDKKITALERLVAALKEKIQIMEGADNG